MSYTAETKCRKCGLTPDSADALNFHWELGEQGWICDLCRNKPGSLIEKIVDREIEKRIRKLSVELIKCRGCDREIFWIKTKSHKSAPVTLALINHFIDCPKSKSFRKK